MNARASLTREERARRRRRRIRNAWWGPAVFAFLALVSFATPWLVPVPRTDEIVMIVIGFVAAPLAVVLFRMNLDKWKEERARS